MNPSESNLKTSTPTPAELSSSLYVERSGKGSRAIAEKLVQPPERQLSPEEMDEALAYEQDLCDMPVSEDLTIETLMRTRDSESLRFFADAFLKGHVHLEGLEGELRQPTVPSEVYAWLAQAARDQTLTTAQFRSLSRQSAVYYKTEVKQALLREERPSAPVIDSMAIALNPDKTLHFADAASNARSLLLAERAAHTRGADGVDGAKRSFVDIYLKKINGILAVDVRALRNVIVQSRLIGDEDTAKAALDALPENLQYAVDDDSMRTRLFKRLDYIRNGIGYDEQGKASAVDAAVFVQPTIETGEELDAPVFTLEQKERMQATFMTKDEIYRLLVDIVNDAGMLSNEDPSTWSPTRGKRAADELFQVVYQPTKDTIAVNSVTGAVLSPNAPRSVYDVLTVTSHELVHIDQAQADRELSKLLRIGALAGRRVNMLRETGANVVQRQFERALFGVSKPVAYAYARSIQAMEAGGDVFDATRAFYNEKRAANPSLPADALATEAADRVLRLGIAGTDSKPMAYAEENLMNSELSSASEVVRRRAGTITALDLDDQLRLHKHGLMPNVDMADYDWLPKLMKHMQPYIDRALNTGQN